MAMLQIVKDHVNYLPRKEKNLARQKQLLQLVSTIGEAASRYDLKALKIRFGYALKLWGNHVYR
jgi:hypothetical protein